MVIIQHPEFPSSQYYREVTWKTQIVLHHTVSGNGVQGDIDWWRQTPDRIAAHYIIERDGTIHQLFDDKYWAYHLGLKIRDFKEQGLNYINLNKNSIAIELDSWGPLAPEDNFRNNVFRPIDTEYKKLTPDFSKPQIPLKHVYEYCTCGKFRNYQWYEAYTPQQVDALHDLLVKLVKRHDIKSRYNEDMWFLSTDALRGEAGIWTHASFRKDKTDCHPQAAPYANLLGMLKTLK